MTKVILKQTEFPFTYHNSWSDNWSNKLVYNTKSAHTTDNYQTPIEATRLLKPYIKKSWIVWEPASGQDMIVNEIIRWGNLVIKSDVTLGQDFLKWEPQSNFDCIVTNPPFSLKNEFLDRCSYFYTDRGKSFALLVPLETLCSIKRFPILKHLPIQLIIPNKRIPFLTFSGKKSKPNCSSMWLTCGLGLEHDIIFRELL